MEVKLKVMHGLPEKVVLKYFKKCFKFKDIETHLIKRGLNFPKNNLV